MNLLRPKTGGPTEIVSERYQTTSHLTVFIKHFLGNPQENFRILRKLYVENGWSASEISQFSGWPASTIKTALQVLKIKRPRKTSRNTRKYGWKLKEGRPIPHKSEQATIDKMADYYAKHGSFRKVADMLNQKGVPTKENGESGKWCKTVVLQILRRERPNCKKPETRSGSK